MMGDPMDARRRERILAERTRELARRRRASLPQELGGEPTLVCSIGRNHFGMPVAAVAAVLPERPCAPMPGSSPGAIGLFGHEGRAVSALDLATLLGLAAPREGARPGCFVLLKGGEPRVALRVDEAVAVTRLRPDEAGDTLGREGGSAFATAYAHMPTASGPALVALLDIRRLLSQFSSLPVPGA